MLSDDIVVCMSVFNNNYRAALNVHERKEKKKHWFNLNSCGTWCLRFNQYDYQILWKIQRVPPPQFYSLKLKYLWFQVIIKTRIKYMHGAVRYFILFFIWTHVIFSQYIYIGKYSIASVEWRVRLCIVSHDGLRH